MTFPLLPRPVLPSRDEVRAFEVELGFDLPDDYRAFLLGCDGGVLQDPGAAGGEEAYVAFRAEAVPPLPEEDGWIAPDGFWDIAVFYGLLRPPGEYGSLREVRQAMRDWDHPDELLPIASQLGGATYFLCLAGARRGQVLFPGAAFLEARAEGQPIIPANYHRLTESFRDLLSGLDWRRS